MDDTFTILGTKLKYRRLRGPLRLRGRRRRIPVDWAPRREFAVHVREIVGPRSQEDVDLVETVSSTQCISSAS